MMQNARRRKWKRGKMALWGLLLYLYLCRYNTAVTLHVCSTGIPVRNTIDGACTCTLNKIIREI